jgi:hypothetical protein
MRCHDGRYPRLHGGHKWGQVDGLDLVGVNGDHGQLMVRVPLCPSKPREVFGDSHDPSGLEGLDDPASQLCHPFRVITKGPTGQMPFRLPAAHVHDRGKIHVEPHEGHLLGRDRCELLCALKGRGIASNGLVSWKKREGRLQSGYPSSLLVKRKEKRNGPGLYCNRLEVFTEPGKLEGGLDIS